MKNNTFRWDSRPVRIFEIFIDLLLVLLGFTTVLVIQTNFDPFTLYPNGGKNLILSNIFFLVSSFIFFRVYKTSAIEKKYTTCMFSIFFALILSNITAYITAVVTAFFIKDFSYIGISFLFTIWVQLLYIGLFKLAINKFVNQRIYKTAMIIGSKEECEALAIKLITAKNEFIRLKYMVSEDSNKISKSTYELMEKVDQVYITPGTHDRLKERVVGYCLANQNKDAIVVPNTYQISLVNSTAYQVSDILTLKVESLHISLESQVIKRAFDIVTSIIGLIILSPLLLIVGFAIKLSDGGSVFFRQERVTQENIKFNIFKFRSMIPDAEKHTGVVQASDNDSRITPIGKIIRATRIDELPQLLNVIKGEMSIVGPRALRIEEVSEFEDINSDFKFRAHVKAGITGLAQTIGRYDTSFEDKLRLDLMYIRNYSFINDLILIVQTILVIFDRDSSRGVTNAMPFEEFIKHHGYRLDYTSEKHVGVMKIYK